MAADEVNEQPTPVEDGEDSDGDGNRSSLPTQLQNWQVVEIDGESDRAVEQESDDEPSPSYERDETTEQEPADQLNDRLVLTVPEKRISLAPGATARITIQLLNNSPTPLVVDITVGGDVSMTWFPDLPAAASAWRPTNALLGYCRP